LAAGGLMAILVALTRWEAIHILDDAGWFYRLAGARRTGMLLFWFLLFAVDGLYFGVIALLTARMMAPAAGWAGYILMLAGSLRMMVTMLTGRATVMFTAYPPLEASQWFYLSYILFAVGALIAVVVFLVNVVGARVRGEVQT